MLEIGLFGHLNSVFTLISIPGNITVLISKLRTYVKLYFDIETLPTLN